MIAFHFPPMSGSSGVQRSLKFSAYLPKFGWQPTVLTAHPRVHPNVSDDQLSQIPADVAVQRAFAVDSARHLSLRGRYPRFLAHPDRWMSWWFGGVPAGLRLIRRYRPTVIWSTFPIATAHWIGGTLARLSGLPWVADFRDSMTEDEFPPDPKVREVLRRFEQNTVKRADRVVFTAPGTKRMYQERYPQEAADKWQVIENGFDEESFAACAQPTVPADHGGRIVLVHSGLLYPSERDPRPFFAALARLRDEGRVGESTLKVVLRATGHDSVFGPMIEAHRLGGIVELAPAVPYTDALDEMLAASGLLLFQAANCNHQIPAKLYEYLRAQRPIFALTDPAGDTADQLRRCGLDDIARIDSADDIAGRLARFLDSVRRREASVARDEVVRRYSRFAQTGELARVLDLVTSVQVHD